jgi:hypothetical protein
MELAADVDEIWIVIRISLNCLLSVSVIFVMLIRYNYNTTNYNTNAIYR